MFRKRSSSARRLLLVAVATLVFLSGNTRARAELIELSTVWDADHNTSSGLVWDDETNEVYYWYVDHDYGGTIFMHWGYINPSPDGGSTGTAPDMDVALEAAKKIGGSPLQEANPLNTPIGRGLVESSKVPGAEIDPWDLGSMTTEDLGFGGGGGGFDPGVPIGEQIGIKKQQGQGKDDDGDGNGGDKNETFYDISDVAPEIVDPPPEPINKNITSANGLWDVPAATNAFSPAKNSFTLMGSFTPSAAGPAGLSNGIVQGLGNANMLGGVLNRGAMNPGVVNRGAMNPGSVIGRGFQGMGAGGALPATSINPGIRPIGAPSTQLR